MAAFKFQGFETGTAVALSVDQGALSDSASVSTWGQSAASSLSLTLGASRLSGTAPMGVLFSAEATSDEPRVESGFHDVEGIWRFSNPGTYTALGNSPIWGADRNIAYGPNTVHVFETPGTYEVSYQATDGSGIAIETITITVDDPDVVFAGADTAVVSSASNFSGAPTGASQHTSISAAVLALSGRTNQRILLRAGEDFSNDMVSFSESGGSNRRFSVGKFGSGANPVIEGVRHSGNANNVAEVMTADIDIVGNYDPTATSQPSDPNGDGISWGFQNNAILNAHKTVWNVNMSGISGIALHLSGNGRDPGDQNRRLYVGNTRIIGWFDYAFLSGDGGEVGFCGTTLQQPTGTVNGRGKNSGAPYWPDHGPFRLTRPYGETVFSNCDLTSFNSWAASSGNRSMQNFGRWNEGYHSDQKLVFDRCRMEGGRFVIYADTGGGAGISDNFVVVDRVVFINSDHDKAPIGSPMGGVTYRNCITVVPDTAPGTSTGTQKMFGDDNANNSGVVGGAQNRRSEFYSNALIDLRSDANARSRTGNQDRNFAAGGYSDISNSFFGNNILHAPNMATGGNTAQAPLSTASNWSVLYDGERWEGASVDTSRAYGDEVTAFFQPQTGSAAIGGATGKVSLLDFFGNARSDVLAGLARNTPSEGPFEPNVES